MAIWDFLKRNNNQVTPIQLDANGNIDEQASMNLAQRTTPMTLADRLFGRTLTKDTLDVNNETGEGKLQTVASYQPGLLNDIASGARENFATGFAANNLRDNQLADGRKKGFGYRLGEGLGTIGRVLESPMGRGLLTAGIVGATGGSGLEALAYGLQGGTLNQQLRKADNLYRQQLKDNYGFSDEQLNQVKGYINNDTFNNLTKSSYNMQRAQNQLAIAMQKDNTARARMIMQGLNNGTITPETAGEMIQAYGITNADFQESNSTRKVAIDEYLAPHKANLYDSGGYAALTNAGANATRAGAYDFDVHNNRGGNPPTKAQILQNPTVRSNLVEYKKTMNAKERQKMNDWFLTQTGYTADYLLGEI